MVSLEEASNPKGGFKFETSTNEDYMENIVTEINDLPHNDELPLTTMPEPNFKKIKTTLPIVVNILIIVIFELGVFLLPLICDKNDVDFNSFDMLIYIHAGLWLIKFLFDRFYHSKHMQSKRNGYLEFYRQTRLIRALPLLIISAGNSFLLVLVKVLTTHCPEKCTSANLTPVNFLQMFVSAETALLLPILTFYLLKTYKFNTECKAPDINNETERPLFLQTEFNDIGFKDTSYIKNVLESQADMIQYLQQRNTNLVKKLYNLKVTQPDLVVNSSIN